MGNKCTLKISALSDSHIFIFLNWWISPLGRKQCGKTLSVNVNRTSHGVKIPLLSSIPLVTILDLTYRIKIQHQTRQYLEAYESGGMFPWRPSPHHLHGERTSAFPSLHPAPKTLGGISPLTPPGFTAHGLKAKDLWICVSGWRFEISSTSTSTQQYWRACMYRYSYHTYMTKHSIIF